MTDPNETSGKPTATTRMLKAGDRVNATNETRCARCGQLVVEGTDHAVACPVNATNEILSAEAVVSVRALAGGEVMFTRGDQGAALIRELADSHEALRSKNRALRDALAALLSAMDGPSQDEWELAIDAARALLGEGNQWETPRVVESVTIEPVVPE